MSFFPEFISNYIDRYHPDDQRSIEMATNLARYVNGRYALLSTELATVLDERLAELLAMFHHLDREATRQFARTLSSLPLSDEALFDIEALMAYWDECSEVGTSADDSQDDVEDVPTTTEVYGRALVAAKGNHELAAEAASQYPGDFI